MADEQQVRASIEQTLEQLGGSQIVVNCAGIVHVAPLDRYSSHEWDRLMAVNVKSIFLAVKHALPALRANPRSYVVNIGSVSSLVAQASTPAYTASKGAVLQLSRSIALDYAADGLRCNCICPGITDTPMLRYHLSKAADPEAALAERLARVPLGVAMQPSDIAKAALYLSCEDSSGITGTSLVVDGGYLAAAEWKSSRRRGQGAAGTGAGHGGQLTQLATRRARTARRFRPSYTLPASASSPHIGSVVRKCRTISPSTM